MGNPPRLLDTSRANVRGANITYHLDGQIVPVLSVDLKTGQSLFFEHHTILWKQSNMEITVRPPMKGAFKRALAGMDIFVTDIHGPGQVAFSRDSAGQVMPVHLNDGQELHVREHQFLAATSNVDYNFERVKGFSNALTSGLFIDKFHSRGEGLLWLHGQGNVFEKTLEAGEKLDVDVGGWVYKDPTVKMETTFQSLATGLLGALGANGLLMNRFTGPGRVGIQSMYFIPPEPK